MKAKVEAGVLGSKYGFSPTLRLSPWRVTDLAFGRDYVRILQADTKKRHQHADPNLCQDNRLATAIRYIKENLRKPLTVKELSQKVCMSESSFHRSFKQELGTSPINFINEERIRLATRLLKDPQRQIKEIYLDCGFESRSYFNRQFKKQVQMSPKEFRKME